jgi:hypothetical protein
MPEAQEGTETAGERVEQLEASLQPPKLVGNKITLTTHDFY